MRITKIGIKQTTKFAVIFYLVTTLIFFVPFLLITLLVGGFGSSSDRFPFGGILLLLLPLVYAVFGGLMVAVTSFLYNIIAKRIGGVEVELEDLKTEINRYAQTER